MSRNVRILSLLATLAAIGLTGCGRSPVTAAVQRAPGAIATRADAPTFVDTPLAELVAHGDDPAYEGRLVAVEASFDRYVYALEYGRTYHGYRLWDHAGHWLLCQNIYTVSSVYPGAAPDPSRDLAAGPAQRLLAFGTFARLEGKFHTTSSAASHGGVYQVPASLDVYTIDGHATHELVNR